MKKLYLERFINRKTYLKEFIKFLFVNNCYYEYLECLTKTSWNMSMSPSCYICDAFPWKDKEIWHVIDNKWRFVKKTYDNKKNL